MSTQQDHESDPIDRIADVFGLTAGGLLFVIIVIVAVVLASQQNNQVARPVPWAPPAPVVPEIPNIAGELRQRRTLCEDRVSLVKGAVRSRRFQDVALTMGMPLYSQARADSDYCITYLQAGLARRFRGDDVGRVAQALHAAEKSADRFVNWTDQFHERQYGAVPTSELLSSVDAWLDRVSRENEQAIAQLRADLEGCRMRPWDQLP